MEHDTLFDGLVGLPLVCGHLFARFEARQMHGPDTRHTQGASRGIHRHVTAADHHDVRADLRLTPGVHFVKELQPHQRLRRIFTRYAQLLARPGAYGDEYGVEPAVVALRRLQKSLGVFDAAVCPHLHAKVLDVLDFPVEHIVGEPVARNTVSQHTAHPRLGLENCHTVAHFDQVVCGRQARRTAADDGYLPVPGGDWLSGRIFKLIRVCVDVVGGEPLQVAHGHGLVHLVAVAVVLAGVVADATADRRKRALLADQVVGFLELPLGDKCDVSLCVYARRARGFARRSAVGLRYPVDVRNRLRVRTEDRLSLALGAIELTGQRHGADFDAVAAGVTFFEVDVSRALADADLEVARLTADVLNVRERDDLDIPVARALDELGRQRAHGAVAGGKGLVQLGHPPADCRRGLDEVDLEAGLGQIQRRLDASYSRAADHDGADRFGGGLVGAIDSFAGPDHWRPSLSTAAAASPDVEIPLSLRSPAGSTTSDLSPNRPPSRPIARPSNCVK